MTICAQFDDLMMVILSRPSTSYTKADMEKNFATLAGKNAEPGKIDYDLLNRAIRFGAGGIEENLSEEMMTMMDHISGGEIDYKEIVDLFMGNKQRNK